MNNWSANSMLATRGWSFTICKRRTGLHNVKDNLVSIHNIMAQRRVRIILSYSRNRTKGFYGRGSIRDYDSWWVICVVLIKKWITMKYLIIIYLSCHVGKYKTQLYDNGRGDWLPSSPGIGMHVEVSINIIKVWSIITPI